MATSELTLKQMVLQVLQEKQGEQLKPSEIALLITQQFPTYCEQKIQKSAQLDLNVTKQISNQISAAGKTWQNEFTQLKSSEETPRTYWWEPNSVAETEQTACTVQAEIINNSDNILEHSLYPKLAAYLDGMRSHKIYPKRIDEKYSSNTNGKDGNKSLHPDMVALEDLMPQPQWTNEMKEWATKAGAPQSRLWSFEVKTIVSSVSDARRSYIQALANSAWANYGYLVVIQTSDKANAELKILHDLYGIGVIKLSVDNPIDETIVMFPAREKEKVDWGTCNRIASQNSDFKKYIELVADFHLTRKTRDSDWYPLPKVDD